MGRQASLSRSLPRVVVRGRGDGTAAKYRLIFHEIWLATGEDRAIGDQQVLGNARIRNHDEELVAHPDRE